MKHKVVGALIAVALISGVVAVAPAMAEEESAVPGELVTKPVTPPGSGAAPPPSGTCSSNQVCAWSGYSFTGTFSWWPESNTGCHNHASNPELRSGVNFSKYRERVGGWGYVQPNFAWESVGGVVTGELCWPA
jgi:hypothetical protein